MDPIPAGIQRKVHCGQGPSPSRRDMHIHGQFQITNISSLWSVGTHGAPAGTGTPCTEKGPSPPADWPQTSACNVHLIVIFTLKKSVLRFYSSNIKEVSQTILKRELERDHLLVPMNTQALEHTHTHTLSLGFCLAEVWIPQCRYRVWPLGGARLILPALVCGEVEAGKESGLEKEISPLNCLPWRQFAELALPCLPQRLRNSTPVRFFFLVGGNRWALLFRHSLARIPRSEWNVFSRTFKVD